MLSTDIPHLLQSARSGSTAAPIELFVQIRDAVRTLTGGAPMATSSLPARTCIREAYLQLSPSQAPDRKAYATFLAIGASVVRHLMVEAAHQHLGRATVHRSTPSFQTLSHMIQTGAPFESRHWSTLRSLDEALSELGRDKPQVAEALEGRLFGEMSEDELADSLSLPRSVVQSALADGDAWLQQVEAAERLSARHRPFPKS
jgi:hypothetical protein